MLKAVKVIFVAGAVCFLTGSAYAGVTLNAARVGGKDPATLAKFYETAFGLKEVNRLSFPGMLEIMMNFGDSTTAAKANHNAQIVVIFKCTLGLGEQVSFSRINVVWKN